MVALRLTVRVRPRIRALALTVTRPVTPGATLPRTLSVRRSRATVGVARASRGPASGFGGGDGSGAGAGKGPGGGAGGGWGCCGAEAGLGFGNTTCQLASRFGSVLPAAS